MEINREIIQALLEHTGLKIVFAEDGREATSRIRTSDLLGADSLPIIAMTANVFKEGVERYLADGMNGHLGKPLDSGEVIAMLKRYLLSPHSS